MELPQKAIVVVTLLSALSSAWAVFEAFPYFDCPHATNSARRAAYSLDPIVRRVKANEFCFTVRAAVPMGCDTYCCNQADLRKIEIDANPECKIGGVTIAATVNGVPTKVAPTFDYPRTGPPGSAILRITQLGLNLSNADGAEVCIALYANNGGIGCTTLTKLCAPPEGAPAGTCSAALIDSQLDCCPISKLGVPTPPPPSPRRQPSPRKSPSPRPIVMPPPPRAQSPQSSPPPPSPPPAEVPSVSRSPPPATCDVCVTAKLQQVHDTPFPVTLQQEFCERWAKNVSADLNSLNGPGAGSVEPAITCEKTGMAVCTSLTLDAASKLQGDVDMYLPFWGERALGGDIKPAYFGPYQRIVEVGGPNSTPGCVQAFTVVGDGDVQPPEGFPLGTCDSTYLGTPFAVFPAYYQATSRSEDTNMWCFYTVTVTPIDPESPCSGVTSLTKAEIYADESLRGKIKSFGLQPVGAEDMTFVPVSWGPVGSGALKVSGINWSQKEANGGQICVETVSSITSFDQVCGEHIGICRVALYNEDRTCCPAYKASLV